MESQGLSSGDRRSAYRRALLTLFVGLWLTAGFVLWSVAKAHREEAAVVASHGDLISDRMSVAVGRASSRLVAVSSLFRASVEITEREFATFVGDVGLEEGMRAVAYIEIVPRERLVDFIRSTAVTRPGFGVFDLDAALEPKRLEARDTHMVVVFMEPADEFSRFVGADVGGLRWLRGTIERALASGEPTATAQFRRPDGSMGPLVQFQPVRDLDGEIVGLIAGVVDLEAMVLAEVGESVAGAVGWSLTDISFDQSARFSEPGTPWHSTVNILDRRWRIEVWGDGAAAGLWSAERAGALAAGLIASIASAGFVFAALRRLAGRRDNQRLAAISAQKDHFLATVSHELRTPLTAVVGFIDEIRERWDELDAEERHDLLTLASDEASEMAALVDDLLVGARLESGRPLAVADGTLDMAQESRSVVARLSRARGAEVEVTGSGWARGDRVRVRQILRNVIDNAFKHGAAPVTIRVETQGHETVVRVGDGGPGVPECCHDVIFDVDADRAAHGHRAVPNSNRLGLPVSAYLAELMNGALSYDTETGEFVLRLPRVPTVEVREQQHLMELLVR